MKPANFNYHVPASIDEAVSLLSSTPTRKVELSRGQSLVPTVAFRLARPAHLIDISGISALDKITQKEDRLIIGAGVRHSAFHKPVCNGPLGALLAEVVQHIAHLPIRAGEHFVGH